MKTLSFKLRSLALVMGALSATGAFAQDTFPVESPYSPSREVREMVSVIGTWAEVYEVAPGELASVVRNLETERLAPPALGVVLPDGFHVQVKGKDVKLKALKFEALRDGKPVAYDNNCRTVPQALDAFKFNFSNFGKLKNVTLNTTVLETYAFAKPIWMGEEGTLQRVPAATEANCKSLDERRVLLRGTLTWTEAGTSHSAPILMQTVQLKIEP